MELPFTRVKFGLFPLVCVAFRKMSNSYLIVLISLVFTGCVKGQAPGVFGVDMSASISAGITQADWTCMNQQGNYTFAIIQGWQGGYQQNNALASAVSMAWNGGFSHVDVYAFMCPNCKNGVGSVDALVNYLRSNSVTFGMIWLDVEQCDGCWSSDLDANCQWVLTLVQEYQRLGVKIGMYSSEGEWPQTVGSGCNSFSSLPLWYAHYDGVPSFDDGPQFYDFGGWSQPAIKQFDDKAGNSCGVSVDRNWYP